MKFPRYVSLVMFLFALTSCGVNYCECIEKAHDPDFRQKCEEAYPEPTSDTERKERMKLIEDCMSTKK